MTDDVPTQMYRVDMRVTLFTEVPPSENVEVKIREAMDLADIRCSLGTVKVQEVGEILYKGRDE